MHHMHFLACILFAISSWNKVILTIVSNPIAPVPDPEHTSLEVFKEAGDVNVQL